MQDVLVRLQTLDLPESGLNECGIGASQVVNTPVLYGKYRGDSRTLTQYLIAIQLAKITVYLRFKVSLQHLEKVSNELLKLRQRKTRLSQDRLKEKIDALLHGQFLDQIVKYEIKDDGFSFWSDHIAFKKLYNSLLGRQILVTNRSDWSSEEIIDAFNQKAKVEYSFRNLKNPDHLTVRPQFHWTDQKLRVHAMLCVIAYLLTMVLFKKAKELAHYPHDVDALLNDLQFIRLAAVKHEHSVNAGPNPPLNAEGEHIPPYPA